MKEFGKFAWDKTASLPMYFWDFVTRVATGRLTSSLHGRDGEAIVVAAESRSNLDEQFLRTMDTIEKERVRIAFLAQVPLPPARADVYPRLWEGVRKLSFAVLDGSAGPEGVQMPQAPDGGSQALVLVDANLVFPDWSERWPVPSVTTVPLDVGEAGAVEELAWLDVPRAQELLLGLETRRERLQSREREMLERLDVLQAERDEKQDQIMELEFEVAELRDARDWVKDDLIVEADEVPVESQEEGIPDGD